MGLDALIKYHLGLVNIYVGKRTISRVTLSKRSHLRFQKVVRKCEKKGRGVGKKMFRE